MNDWTLYPVFVATTLSVGGWAYFVWREHDAAHPVELSKLAVRNRANATYYRILMWLCPLLFAITGWWYVAPRVGNTLLVAMCLISCGCCMLAGVFLPKGGKPERLHDIFAYTMGFAMLLLAFVAAWVVPKYSLAMWLVALTMTILAIAGPRLRHHYIFYELGFIYLSHLSMILITLGAS
ncbi:MAG: hypothetical protein WAQ24_03740 [Candidatus Saccharimonadales bacterium]